MVQMETLHPIYLLSLWPLQYVKWKAPYSEQKEYFLEEITTQDNWVGGKKPLKTMYITIFQP